MHKFLKISNPIIDINSDSILEDNNIYYLSGEVKSSTIKNVIRFILERNLYPKRNNYPKYLILIINSIGGNVTEAFALIDVMHGSSIPIKTIGIGEIGSCGLWIFMAGKTGLRFITLNTSILSHQYSWCSEGKHHELAATSIAFKHTQERIIKHYMRCTGLDKEIIKIALLPPHDVWLTVNQAIKYGIADKILKL